MFKKPQAEHATFEQIMFHNTRRQIFGERMTRNFDRVKPVEIWVTLAAIVAAGIKLYWITH